ncbi:MAG: glucose 1-dehydrogenase [Candidatus Binatia bacterium]
MKLLDRFRLDGKAAIVTGAGRGIGRAIALALAEAGARVAVGARTLEDVERTAGEARALGVDALAVGCDVTKRADLERLVEETRRRFGRIDVLVNNAGGCLPTPALRTSEKSFNEAFQFNVTSAFVLTRLVVPHMLEGEGGSIINISSGAGRLIQKGFAAYGTSKAALSFLSRLLGAELAPKVRVNAIAVGAILTDALTGFVDDSTRAKMAELTPMKRLGTVEDIAAAALYLASPASGWITGKVLEVDGGTEATNLPFEIA